MGGGRRSSDKAELEDDRGRAGSAPPGELGSPRGPSPQARAHGGRWIGSGYRESPEQAKGAARAVQGHGRKEAK